jgi:DNA repair protein RadC
VQAYENKISIKAWAEADRPREKLLGQGRRSLTDAELIAILIGSGSRDESAVELSRRILHHYQNDLNVLGKASVAELSRFKGIGEAKAIAIIAALELGRRRNDADVAPPEHVGYSRDAYNLLKRNFIDLQHEEFWLLLLNKNNKVLGRQLVSRGSTDATPVDAKIVFRMAIEQQATAIILAHNHPSGNLKPSQQDIALTHKLREAGKLLDIAVVDHLIFTDQGYLSLGDEGLMD